MSMVSTFYLSRLIGNKVFIENQSTIGKLVDFIVDLNYVRPKLIAAKIKINHGIKLLDFSYFNISKQSGQYMVNCKSINEIEINKDGCLFLAKNILDKQIVDIDGRKVVRVNDIRLAVLSNGIYAIAVDVGVEGLLRRLGVAKPIKKILKPFRLNLPSKLILWDEVATVDFSTAGLKLTKEQSKLSTLHPSDLADIIEELDMNTRVAIFKSLNEEQAADVLEELEPEDQITLLESLTVEKAADMLEKMPADEAADILFEMEEEKAEELLCEMEKIAQEEVRELMEYPDNTVGSFMATDFISFTKDITVGETLDELRKLKPESDDIYYLYVLDEKDALIATVSIRDIVISYPDVKLSQIMKTQVIYVYDYDKIDSLAKIISKYNLLALPVVNKDMKMMGTVIIDDIMHRLLKSRKIRL